MGRLIFLFFDLIFGILFMVQYTFHKHGSYHTYILITILGATYFAMMTCRVLIFLLKIFSSTYSKLFSIY